MNQDDPDTALLARIAEQEPAAVREMVARKLPRLLALATRLLGDRMEAEDVAQETFMRIWQQAPHWRPGTARFDTWLHRVVLNLCYDRLRRRRELPSAVAHGAGGADAETPGMPSHIGVEAVDPGPAPDARLDDAERSAQVGAALARLPARQREALVLQYYQELSNGATAELMGITIEALESLLARARRNMRGYLMEQGDAKDQ